MERTWMKVRTLSGKELLGYTEEKEKKQVPEGQASVEAEDYGKIELHAPVMIWVDAEKKVHMIPETDASNLKNAIMVINAAAIEAYMVVPETSDLVKAISAQLSGIVIPKPGVASKIVDINGKK